MSPNESDSSAKDGNDLTGKRLGNYRLLRRLGRGGMAIVYLAQQTTLNRSVAIKVLRPELAVDKAYVARFHREAQAAAALNQANIVQIIEIAEIEGIHLIVQEYVRGQNLRQYLGRSQVVEPVLAVSIMRQVAAALQESGKRGIVHRDIKPENIMITATGDVKVADFGLARVASDRRSDLTQIGITMGTPLYMSPEQAEGSPVDVRSDLYSLGITAWQMFAGRPPFEGENPLTVAVKHLKEEVPSLEKIRPDLPKPLCQIIHKLVNKNPDERFQSPALLIKELRNLEIQDIADWDQLSEKLAVQDPALEGDEPTQTRLEVTRQLETLMSGHFRAWWLSPRLLVAVALMMLTGVAAGAWYARANPPENLLVTDSLSEGQIRKYDSAEKQYLKAWTSAWSGKTSRAVQEELWKSVEKFFPAEQAENTYSCRKAAVRLGVFYLDYDGDSDDRAGKLARLFKAREVFGRLANINNDRAFRIIGLAGKAITLSEIQQETGDDSYDPEISLLLEQIELERSELDREPIYNLYLRDRLDDLILDQFPLSGGI